MHLILGGQGKGQDFAPLRAAAANARVYLIGEDAERIGEAVGGEPCGDLETRRRAGRRARPRAGDVVLLSPACASFDQFADYEARGRAFKELVRARRSSGSSKRPLASQTAHAISARAPDPADGDAVPLAGGAVMVYSASSARTLLGGTGDGSTYLVKYLMYGAFGLVLMQVMARRGLELAQRLSARSCSWSPSCCSWR